MTVATPARDVLTETEARERAGRVSNVSYDLRIELTEDETYRARATIRFDHTGGGDLFVDLRAHMVTGVTLNGHTVSSASNGYRLILPAAALEARCTLEVEYQNEYDHTGDGVHRFVDPEDGEAYIYTNFEPFGAHRLFPCFDQPDIKASYSVEVTAPASWQVIANAPCAGREPAGDDTVIHRFPSAQRFSTYLVALVAGPFHAVHGEHRGVPLGLYSRRSLAHQLNVDAQELFTVTAQGLDFYAELFDQPYPFAKYDQLFVPEFNPGAMENVGAVTFSERFIFRDPPTERQRLERAEVLLHELAHMWFGNLTTMRWWNDLWLNESFATYVAFLALTEATRFREAWKWFNTSMKRWAYRQDQLITTHPIAGSVSDTDATFLNFDGITYGKGAAVLKQLVASIGRDGFAAGIRAYFRRHAWDNATLADFLRALEEGSGRALGEWARLWLETSSVNTLSTSWTADDARIRQLSLRQAAPDAHPILRPHALQLGLGREADGWLAVEAMPVSIDGARLDVTQAVGRATPALVFPNHGDHAYAKVELDEVSLHYVREHLERVDDPLLRQLLWMSLWEMVRDRRLRSGEFLDIVREKLPVEMDLDLVEAVFDRTEAVLSFYVPEARRETEAEGIFRVAWEALRSRPAGDAQIVWARATIMAAGRPEDVAVLLRLLDGHDLPPALTVDQEMRWAIVAKAVAFDRPGAMERLAGELTRDGSDRGQRAAIRAQTSRPSGPGKEAAWERIRGDGYGSLHLTAAAMSGFLWPHQRSLVEPFVGRFFDDVPDIFAARDRPFARAYLRWLYPALWADPSVLDRTRGLLAELGEEDPTLSRLLRESADDLERAIGVRAYAAPSGGGPFDERSAVSGRGRRAV